MLIVLHLSLMIAACLCLVAGIGMAMFGRKKKKWLSIHKGLNLAGVIGLLAGGVMAFTNVVVSEGVHLASFHQWIGITAILLCSLTLYLGFYSFKAKNKMTARTIHRQSGRLSILSIFAALTLGLQMIGII